MKGNALVHFIRFLLNIDTPITQTSKSERLILNKYASKSMSIIEIGIFEGVNTAEFALHSPIEACVYAIDPFFKGILGFNYGKYIAKLNWNRKKVQKKIKVIEGFSWDVIDQLPTNIDLIFIDGDHSFEGVSKDFNLYAEILSDNGIIALHDARLFENGWTQSDWGPVRLVEEVIKPSKQWIIVDEIDSLVLIKKNSF